MVWIVVLIRIAEVEIAIINLVRIIVSLSIFGIVVWIIAITIEILVLIIAIPLVVLWIIDVMLIVLCYLHGLVIHIEHFS